MTDNENENVEGGGARVVTATHYTTRRLRPDPVDEPAVSGDPDFQWPPTAHVYEMRPETREATLAEFRSIIDGMVPTSASDPRWDQWVWVSPDADTPRRVEHLRDKLKVMLGRDADETTLGMLTRVGSAASIDASFASEVANLIEPLLTFVNRRAAVTVRAKALQAAGEDVDGLSAREARDAVNLVRLAVPGYFDVELPAHSFDRGQPRKDYVPLGAVILKRLLTTRGTVEGKPLDGDDVPFVAWAVLRAAGLTDRAPKLADVTKKFNEAVRRGEELLSQHRASVPSVFSLRPPQPG